MARDCQCRESQSLKALWLVHTGGVCAPLKQASLLMALFVTCIASEGMWIVVDLATNLPRLREGWSAPLLWEQLTALLSEKPLVLSSSESPSAMPWLELV